MCAQKLSFDYAHTLHTVRIVHNAHSVHRSRVQKGKSCDCINFVRATDPPYNTGNEGWVYNDNVNDSRMRDWLHKTVGKEGEDLSRHDKWLDAGRIVCRESYTLPPVITPSKATDVIPKSLYEAEADDMNDEERDFIDAVVALDNVKWWHRIIENKGFRLNGYINHYPDFLVMTNASRLVLLEYKGGDRDNSNSREKLELGRQWDAHSGENYRYFMVFKNRELNADGAYTMDRFLEVMREL